MAGVNAQGDIVNWFRGLESEIEGRIAEDIEDYAREGAEFTRGLIATRGTSESGKAGRIESGDMIRDIDHRVDHLSNGRIRGLFGWLGAYNSPEKMYYVYQEGGFWHVNAARAIEGMFAITDAADYAHENLKRKIAARIKSANAPMFNKRVTVFGKETKSGS